MLFHNVTYVIYEDIILMSCFQLCKESGKTKKTIYIFFLTLKKIKDYSHVMLLYRFGNINSAQYQLKEIQEKTIKIVEIQIYNINILLLQGFN